MAFETQYLAGGLIESMDSGTMAYKRVLAMRVSALATTNEAGLTAFDAAFVAQWGFDTLLGMKGLSAEWQERVVLWARMRLIFERADFVSQDLPDYATEPYFYTHHEDQWLNLDARLLWTIVAATERWAAVNLRSVNESNLDDFLTACQVLPFGIENGLKHSPEQLQLAVHLIHIFDTSYEDITDMDTVSLELSVDEVQTRMRQRDYQTHLAIMGWLAEGLQTVVLADQRSAFNALSQVDFGATAVAPLVAEMNELFRKLSTLAGHGSNLNHKLLVLHAEMVAHGYAPEVLFQIMDFLPREGVPKIGDIWVDFDPADVPNAKTLACSLKIWVPEGVTVNDVDVQFSHDYANALTTRYANVDNAAEDDADDFAAANFDDAGVGKTRFIAHSVAGLTGGAGGTVFTLGTFDLVYGEIGEISTAIAPRPYWMIPFVNGISSGTALRNAAITLGGNTTITGNTITLQDAGGNDIILTAGLDFPNGAAAGSTNALAAAIAAVIDDLDGYVASADTNVVTVQTTFAAPPIVFTGDEIITDMGGTPATPSEAEITFSGFTTAVGNTVTLPNLDDADSPHVLVAGTDFDDGATAGSADNLAGSLSQAIDDLPGYEATADTGVVTVIATGGLAVAAGVDPDDIVFEGAEIIADVGGAAEEFSGGVPAADNTEEFGEPTDGANQEGAFSLKGLRFEAGLRNAGGRNYLFPTQG